SNITTLISCSILQQKSNILLAFALDYSDPKLCYVLDGFLGLYGLIITGMFIKEKADSKRREDITDVQRASCEERGERLNTMMFCEILEPVELKTVVSAASAEERAGLPGEYQPDRSDPSATRDTYDSLQMQPLPAR
uniref:T-cell receptor T3 zeta chain n=1 Tax=Xiphophorus maculatus TaxID=8083 RepID=A0A3B5RF98_XIPMA